MSLRSTSGNRRACEPFDLDRLNLCSMIKDFSKEFAVFIRGSEVSNPEAGSAREVQNLAAAFFLITKDSEVMSDPQCFGLFKRTVESFNLAAISRQKEMIEDEASQQRFKMQFASIYAAVGLEQPEFPTI